jgi:hypothetical protein
MKVRELLMASLTLACVACGVLSSTVQNTALGISLALVGLAFGAAALWLHLSRPK